MVRAFCFYGFEKKFLSLLIDMSITFSKSSLSCVVQLIQFFQTCYACCTYLWQMVKLMGQMDTIMG